MSSKFHVLPVVLMLLILSWKSDTVWLKEKHPGYTMFYTSEDKTNKNEYSGIIDAGMNKVELFFGKHFKDTFDIYVHPNRNSLDAQWQSDWKDTSFKSECWMVASGIGTKLDLLSPQVWSNQACEHKYEEKEKTGKLICHELFHVFHGQLNPSHDFSNVVNIDWFVEGFATYASGQCDSIRLTEIKNAIQKNAVPATLDNFWKGKMKYGLSGSVVMYIDKKFGRKKLYELLVCTDKNSIFSILASSEEELLTGWKKFIVSN